MLTTLEKHGVYTFPDFLSDDECRVYTELVYNPPAEAAHFTNSGIFQNKKWVDKDLADNFFSKIQKYIEPSDLAIRANNLIMTGNYEPGQQFNIHTDTGLFYDRINKEKSRWTLLIYLNDDYEGGHTIFYDDNWNQSHDIAPKKGMALLFDIDLWHRGDVLLSGTKQWIGCEIIGKFSTLPM